MKSKWPEIPWKDIAGIRDKLIHGYFGVDLKLVWETILNELPEFKKQITEILRSIQ